MLEFSEAQDIVLKQVGFSFIYYFVFSDTQLLMCLPFCVLDDKFLVPFAGFSRTWLVTTLWCITAFAKLTRFIV